MEASYHLPQISYWVAYRLIPHYTFQSLDKAIETWTKNPATAGPYFYLMACQMRETEPVKEDARAFSTAFGTLNDFDYYLMNYPVPSSVQFFGKDPMATMEEGKRIILAPHFSTILKHRTSGEVSYYILGQAPIGGGTTLRCITESGSNANMGSGPAPDPDLFLERVAQIISQP